MPVLHTRLMLLISAAAIWSEAVICRQDAPAALLSKFAAATVYNLLGKAVNGGETGAPLL